MGGKLLCAFLFVFCFAGAVGFAVRAFKPVIKVTEDSASSSGAYWYEVEGLVEVSENRNIWNNDGIPEQKSIYNSPESEQPTRTEVEIEAIFLIDDNTGVQQEVMKTYSEPPVSTKAETKYDTEAEWEKNYDEALDEDKNSSDQPQSVLQQPAPNKGPAELEVDTDDESDEDQENSYEQTLSFLQKQPVSTEAPSELEVPTDASDDDDEENSSDQPLSSTYNYECYTYTTHKGYHYSETSMSCYKVHTERANWNDASDTCKREGAHLASINNQEEANILTKLFPKGFRVVHASQKRFNINNLIKILSEAGYEKWNVGEPNNFGGNQFCDSMNPDGSIDVIDCNVETAFICERDDYPRMQSLSTEESAELEVYTDNTPAQQVFTETYPDGAVSTEDELKPIANINDKVEKPVEKKEGNLHFKNTMTCYKVHTERANWYDARATCEREGAYLAVIDSQKEANTLSKLYPEGFYAVHTGYHRTVSGDWQNIYGYLSMYDKMHVKSSFPLGYYDCGSMYPDGSFGAITCTDKTAFICESYHVPIWTEAPADLCVMEGGDVSDEDENSSVRPLVRPITSPPKNYEYSSEEVENSSNPPSMKYVHETFSDDDTEESSDTTVSDVTSDESYYECHTDATGYKYYESAQTCYKVHTDRATWNEAEATCVREGGHLAVIRNQRQADILHTLYPDAVHVFIGFSYRRWEDVGIILDPASKREDGLWLTVDGQTLAEAGYENWTEGEPNNAGGREYCGTIYGNIKFDDSACYDVFNFVCEIKRNTQYVY